MFTIYSKTNCSYCVAAKALLTAKNQKFIEFNIEDNQTYKNILFERVPDARTVPQIFLGDQYIGGYNQ